MRCFKFLDPTPSFSQPLRLSSSRIYQSLNFEHTHLQFSLKIVTAPPTNSVEAYFVVIFFFEFMFPGTIHLNTNCFPAPSRFAFQSRLNLAIVLYCKYLFIIFIGYSWFCSIEIFCCCCCCCCYWLLLLCRVRTEYSFLWLCILWLLC